MAKNGSKRDAVEHGYHKKVPIVHRSERRGKSNSILWVREIESVVNKNIVVGLLMIHQGMIAVGFSSKTILNGILFGEVHLLWIIWQAIVTYMVTGCSSKQKRSYLCHQCIQSEECFHVSCFENTGTHAKRRFYLPSLHSDLSDWFGGSKQISSVQLKCLRKDEMVHRILSIPAVKAAWIALLNEKKKCQNATLIGWCGDLLHLFVHNDPQRANQFRRIQNGNYYSLLLGDKAFDIYLTRFMVILVIIFGACEYLLVSASHSS